MRILRYTLVADGPSDACLTYIIDWVLRNSWSELPVSEFKSEVADFRWMREPPQGLQERIEAGYRQFPCDILFIHRDAEREDPGNRVEEISQAVANISLPPYVPVVPVRMTEAWLLIDERAVRRAADNPNGSTKIDLPPLKKLGHLTDPKENLRDCLMGASELKGRRRAQFQRRVVRSMRRVAALIDDFSPLRELAAFRTFETDTKRVVERHLGV